MSLRTTVVLSVVLLLSAHRAAAVYLDAAQTLQLTGHVFTQGSWRMQGSDSGGRNCVFLAQPNSRCTGFTFPDTGTGQLIQERNLLDVEIAQDLAARGTARRLGLDALSYRFRVKYFYEGVYDYGPRAYSEPSSHLTPQGAPDITGQEGLRANRHLDTQHNPIWNAYVDLGKGPLWLRVGRQDLSWGETDGFRLLDMIEPLDNRFGFPLVEDLDDRRIPLWMLRSVLRLGTFGPVSDLMAEGYWVPGTIDDQEAPIPRVGNPFAPPAPPGSATILIPNKNLGNSRGGGRLLGTVGNTATVSVAHYVTYNDAPSFSFPPGAAMPAVQFYQQQITGASATMALPFDPYTIVRTEMAHFWNERVFIPEQSLAGALPNRNTLRWVIGVDRNLWLRWLNPENTFLVSGQYFQTDIFDYSRRIAQPAISSIEFPAAAPPITSFVPRKNDELLFTYLISTLYHHGTISPGVFGAYDARGVNVVVPTVTYQYGTHVQITLKYAIITGVFANLGLFRDRNQLLVRLQYNL